MKKLLSAMRVGALALCLGAASAHGSVVIGGTRVVFPAKAGEVSVRLTNAGTQPSLIEAWVDEGNPHSTPESAKVPFLVTPPLFRMEPGKDQNLRIIATNPGLPADRESLFWLNVLDVPPKPNSAQYSGKNTLQFAVRSRLKLFYRPPGLAGDPLKAPGQVTWKVVVDGKGYALEAHNPTPYHITFYSVFVDVAGKAYSATPQVDQSMVDPFGVMRMPIKDLVQAPASGSSVAYEIVNDYGVNAPFKGAVTL